MAAPLRHVTRRLASQICDISQLRISATSFHTTSICNILSQETLGLEAYKRHRAFIQDKVGDLKERFRCRMEEYMSSSDKNTIFTDDLKTLVYVAESLDDTETTKKMIKRFHQQSNVLRFSSFTFGPLVMRMCHFLNKVDLAHSLYWDPEMEGFFDQMSSNIVLMDMLFEDQQYEQVLKVMEAVEEKKIGGFAYPNDCVAVALGAALKINSAESFQTASKLLSGCQKANSGMSMRSIVFGSTLALKQGEAIAALDVLGLAKKSKSGIAPIAFVNAKAMAFSSLGRFEDVLQLLGDELNQTDRPNYTRRGGRVFKDVLDTVVSAGKAQEDKELSLKIENMVKGLQENGLLIEQSFDDYLFSPIVRRRQLQDGFKSRPRSILSMEQRRQGQENRTQQDDF